MHMAGAVVEVVVSEEQATKHFGNKPKAAHRNFKCRRFFRRARSIATKYSPHFPIFHQRRHTINTVFSVAIDHSIIFIPDLWSSNIGSSSIFLYLFLLCPIQPSSGSRQRFPYDLQGSTKTHLPASFFSTSKINRPSARSYGTNKIPCADPCNSYRIGYPKAR